MVRYQQLKAMAGTHDVKNRSEGARTGKKFVKQKGSGGARHGDRKAPQFRGGGRAFGPTPRSHAIELPKKVRAARAQACALRQGQGRRARDRRQGRRARKARPRALLAQFGKLEWSNALIIDGAELDVNFARAARNLNEIDVLPVQGINVVDILRRHKLVLTKAALEAIEARFKPAAEVTA